jgi:urea transport system substrate-binding protein
MGRDRHHPAHYAVWGYFQSLATPANRQFVDAFKQRFGAERVITDPIEASYSGVQLWANTVRQLRIDDPDRVNQAIGRQSVAAPSGVLAIDAETRHAWRRVYVGHARLDGQFDIQEISETKVRPAPFPPYHSREIWLQRVSRVADRVGAQMPAMEASR